MKRVFFNILFVLSAITIFAQEGRYGSFYVERPPSDLERQGIHGNVHYLISYEGLAVRTNNGVVFSDNPLKIVTEYNKLGNMMRQETFRNNNSIDVTTFKYDSRGVLISKTTTQSNGIPTTVVRYMIDQKSLLSFQMNCYNFSGKLSQSSKFIYNSKKSVVSQTDFGPTGVKRELMLSEYNDDNKVVDEYNYMYHKYGKDSVLYFHAHYDYNSYNNIMMRTNYMLNSDGATYDKKIRHYRYYQYDAMSNWRICCIYINAIESDNRLVPQNMIVRELTYY